MGRPECVGKKVLIAGATPADPENKIKPFKAMACEVTNLEYAAAVDSHGQARGTTGQASLDLNPGLAET